MHDFERDLRLLLLTPQHMLGIDVLRADDHHIQGCRIYAFGDDSKVHPGDSSDVESSLVDALTAIRMLRGS